MCASRCARWPSAKAAILSCLALCLNSPSVAHAETEAAARANPVTVTAIIESRRFLRWCAGEAPICRSQDGSHYVVVVARGDTQRDGVHVQILTGSTGSLIGASPRIVATLFTRALGNTPLTEANSIAWFNDDSQIAFLWHDAQGVKQVFSLELSTHRLRQLTRHPTDIERFAITADGARIAYIALAQRDDRAPEEMDRRGYSVVRPDGFSFFDGNLDGWNAWENAELYLVEHGRSRSPLGFELPSVLGARWPAVFEAGPGGDFLIDLPADAIPLTWDQYTDPLLARVLLPAARRDPFQSKLTQLFVIDRGAHRLRPLWSAPRSFRQSSQVAWSPDGDSVILSGAFVPIDQARSAAALNGSALVEVNVRTGQATEFSRPPSLEAADLIPLSWRDDIVEFTSTLPAESRVWFQKTNAGWRQLPLSAPPATFAPPSTRIVQIELREGLNHPPVIFAADGTGHEAILLELNPDLGGLYTLGRVELVRWTSTDGLAWTGLLILPPTHIAGTRYPLVIQTHGFSPDQFSLIGDNRFPSVFAAQALASENIAVLQMGSPDPGQISDWVATPQEGPVMTAGMEGAIAALVARGLVDGERVGIAGFSRTGFHIEYAITHSNYPYAAAISADSIDQSYISNAFRGWPVEPSAGNGGEPYGEGLGHWLSRSPGFNADRVRTPLRLQVNSGSRAWALTHWEMFSRLRDLDLPVELYVVPRINEGTHNLQNPGQILASAGGAVDWFNFWLNGREDPDPAKAQQFARWRHLRAQRDLAIQRPRRPLLEWRASPLQ